MEYLLTGLANRVGFAGFHRPHLQDEPTIFIPDRQRFAPLLGINVPPAFEVDSPQIIRCFRLDSVADSLATACWAAFSLVHQAGPLKHALETTLAGRLTVAASIDLSDFSWSPVGVGHLDSKHLTDDALLWLIGMPAGTSGLILQAAKTSFLKAFPPLVTRLCADAIFPAKLHKHDRRIIRSAYKFSSLFHGI
jgi:hypothetical protein